MKKYIAFLRGINVGGKNMIDMKILKTVFEDAGFKNVLTYINSGNVIFEYKEDDKLATTIENIIFERFKFKISIVVRDGKNLNKLVKKISKDWTNDDVQRTDVLFLSEKFDDKKSIDLIKKVDGVDNLIYSNGAIIWNVQRKNLNKSGMRKFIGTELYKNMTARNINTVRKLSELIS